MSAVAVLERARELWPVFEGRPGFRVGGWSEVERMVTAEVGMGASGAGNHVWVPPRRLYVVTADTRAPSALTTLFLGWLAGADLTFKLPSGGAGEFEATVREVLDRLGAAWGRKVRLEREWEQEAWEAAETVVVFGRDETVAHFRGLTKRWQRFLGYGHKISAAWL
ncbi:MAG: hypothetical protein SNJ84_10215, partial [Verrucomicrobiia bacterium]